MSDIEKIKRHIGRPIPISITNQDGASDIFYFKPLNISQQALLMEVSKSIKEHGEMEIEVEEEGKMVKKMVPNVTKEDMEGMFDVILDVVKVSIPEITDDDAKDFCNSNFEQLSEALSKLTPENKSKKDVDSLKKAQEVIKRGQDKQSEQSEQSKSE